MTVILDCELQTSGIFLRLDFDKKVSQRRQAQRLIHQLETILPQLDQKSLNSTTPSADFNPISNHDLSEIWQWSSILPGEIPICFHEIIHDQVQQRHDALAVDAWDGQLTYGDLDQHATKTASYLQDEHEDKVRPESIIALCFEKSMWTVVAALAVMKTGRAFTLMVASQPEEHLRTICSQVSQDLIISSASNTSRAARLAKHVVVVDHSNLLRWPPSPPPRVRVYDSPSYSFDIALSNLLHCLAAGGCLCIPSDFERKHSRLAELME